jgi:hypothetical protein
MCDRSCSARFPLTVPGNHYVIRQYGAPFAGDGVITTAVVAGTQPLLAVPSGWACRSWSQTLMEG